MLRKLAVSAAVLAVATGTALAAAPGEVSITLSPNKVTKASNLAVDAQGPFQGVTGLPTSVAMFVQRGFKSDPRSVKTLCSTAQANSSTCPDASKIGAGDVLAHVELSIAGFPVAMDVDVALKLFLGPPTTAGDIASVVIEAHAPAPINRDVSATGRLIPLRSGVYGLEILFDNFPSMMLPAGTTVTVNKITLTAGASRTVRTVKVVKKRTAKKLKKTKKVTKTTYALITNPSTCTGTWQGRLTVVFASGQLDKTLSTTCRKK